MPTEKKIDPAKEMEIVAELESIRLRPRGDVFVDLFKKIGVEVGQDIRYEIGHVDLVRKIAWGADFDYKGEVILQRFFSSYLRLLVFQNESRSDESHNAFLCVENKIVSSVAGRELPVVAVSFGQPLIANTRVFRRTLEILRDLQKIVNQYGVDPAEIEWQPMGQEES